MNDLIGRQAAIDALVGITMFKTKHELMQRVNASVQDEQGWLGAVAECLDEIEDLPSAQPVRHGKWKWLSCTYDRVPKEQEYECSKCHHKTIVHGDDMPWEKYCPNCGAKMDRKEEE